MKQNYDIIIIGSGISGLATAHFLRKLKPEAHVLLLEKGDRAGGAIKSFRQNGFLAEWGPHGFLDNVPASREILHDTGLDKEAQHAPLGDFYRYVCHQGRLVALPQKPQKLLTTPLLTLGQKLRLLGDLWIKPDRKDQNIGQWAARRFGKGVLPLVDAALTGTFAGDFERLSIDAVMPGLRRLEIAHGSVLRGLKQKAKNKKNGSLPAMNNFPQGLERLVAVLSKDKEIVFNCPLNLLEYHDDNWQLTTDHGNFAAPCLIMALPVNGALPLLSQLDSPPVAQIPVARIFNVVMGFTDRAQVPYGFGYLAPEKENRFTLGAMFSSHMFPDRAPEGHVLLEALVGGRRHPEKLKLTDEEIVDRVYDDLKQLIKLPEPPVFVKVLRPESGIPQLEMDHPRLLAWRGHLEEKYRNLHIFGFGWDGISINDMTKSARRVAEAIIAGNNRTPENAPVKPVYF
jgi:oxygen-dependent protoporphyrinogen oxidase